MGLDQRLTQFHCEIGPSLVMFSLQLRRHLTSSKLEDL